MKFYNRQLPFAVLTCVLLVSGCNFTEREAEDAKSGPSASKVRQVQAALDQERFGQAVTLADQLTASDPEDANAWLAAAEAKAAAGSRLAALAALETALGKGMRDAARINDSQYLEPLRSSGEYGALLQRFGLLDTTARAGDTSIDETPAGTVVRAGDVSVTLPHSE